jgi:hypothetical protein
MQRMLVWALVAGVFCCGCGKDDPSRSGAGGSAASSGAPNAGQPGAAGDNQSGAAGNGTGNGGRNGGGSSGDGGAVSGGAAWANAGQSAGHAGGGTDSEWPAWIEQCKPLRNALCGDCTTPECLVCIYGTDQEIESTGVSCDEDPRNYKDYCTCASSGCPPLCREEWR